MGNPPRNPHFILETLEQSFIARGLVGQTLEGHGLAEREVIGAVDLTHATLSQQGNDAVTASQQAAGEKSAFALVPGRTGC
jgi:hypothetical protein